jgi:HKD family nuclease
MSLYSTVLFNKPQSEIASLIADRIHKASTVKIITGFATPGGIAAIADPIANNPAKLKALVVGAATFRAFEALDDLVADGVPIASLHVHLGHTAMTGGRKNPFARFHPMMHSKIYYMELENAGACAFIGSHNITAFALTGLNGEASVMLEGPRDSPEFGKIREHITEAQQQATPYKPSMKEAYAWWTREFIDGMKAEVKIPVDSVSVRTILLFATAPTGQRPNVGDQLYFEIPEGIERIDSLKTEVHLFLFEILPADPWNALKSALTADAIYTCKTLGAENRQGNREVVAQWRIASTPTPVLTAVSGGVLRPTTANGMQQVRAEVVKCDVKNFQYLFEHAKAEWDPIFSDGARIDKVSAAGTSNPKVLNEAWGGQSSERDWRLVVDLIPRLELTNNEEEEALKLVSPDSGSFTLISLRRRQLDEERPDQDNAQTELGI